MASTMEQVAAEMRKRMDDWLAAHPDQYVPFVEFRERCIGSSLNAEDIFDGCLTVSQQARVQLDFRNRELRAAGLDMAIPGGGDLAYRYIKQCRGQYD